jgi:acyl-CoA synthetase (AMP-forming)/AMP-acid ligase II
MGSVGDGLRQRAARTPAEPALVIRAGDHDTMWTWAELDRATEKAASRITAMTRPGRPSVLLAQVDNGAAAVLDLIAT